MRIHIIRAMIRYESRIQRRSLGFWITLIFITLFTLIMISPMNDKTAVRTSLFFADKVTVGTSFIVSFASVYLIGNVLLKEKKLRTIEMLECRQTSSSELVIGKYLGIILNIFIIIFIQIFIGLIYQMVFRHPINLSYYIILVVLVPISSILYISAISLFFSVICRTSRIIYIIFPFYYYFSQNPSYPYWINFVNPISTDLSPSEPLVLTFEILQNAILIRVVYLLITILLLQWSIVSLKRKRWKEWIF